MSQANCPSCGTTFDNHRNDLARELRSGAAVHGAVAALIAATFVAVPLL